MASELFAGRYRLVEKLGAGGMSEVWAADDVELDRRVALKLLAPRADDERFRREARAVAGLGHPNVNQLYDYGESEGRPYMVLELLTGGSLDDRLDGRPLPDGETRRIAADIAAGLEHAHERGLVHRDLKPANVLFDSEGRAKIADFGIARAGDAGTLTEAGTVIGTATTISPEQAAGQPSTPASDVYSFGVLLFWMLTGQPPFLSERPLELLQLHRNNEPAAIASLRPDAPADLAALATAALAKDPSSRPPDGKALAPALAGREADTTRPLPTPRRSRRRRPPASVLAGLAVAVLAAAGAGLALALVHAGNGSSQTPTAASLTLPTVSTAVATSAPPPPTHATTEATTSTKAPTTTARPPATTAPPTTTAPAPAPTLDTTVDLTTTDVTATLPPPTSPPLPGTTTVGSGP